MSPFLQKFIEIFIICLRVSRGVILKILKCAFGALRAAFGWWTHKWFVLAEDIGRETGILAVSLIVNRGLHCCERIFWFAVVVFSILGALILSNLQLMRYRHSPTVVSVDRDYRGWSGVMPAITLCYFDNVDSFKANDYIQQTWNVTIIDEEYFYFMDFLYAVANSSASNYASLARFSEDTRFEDIDLYDLIQSIDHPFEQVITSYDPEYHVQVIPVMTERGSCYAINSPMSEVLTASISNRFMDFNDLQEPLACPYGKQQCFIKMDLYESTGTIAVHSPYEVSASEGSLIALRQSDEITASYKVLETVSSKNLRDLSVEQRKCVFQDEETSQLKVYSKTLCLARCRALMALEMCNCVPFFYIFVDGPSCNPAGFECLLDFKWPIWALHLCNCPSTCTEIEYTVQTVKKSSWGVKANEESSKTDIVTSSFRWDLIPPKVRLRRDVVFSFEDLQVSFGGGLALFLGFSIVSITQLSNVFAYHSLMGLYEMSAFVWRSLIDLCKYAKSRYVKRRNKNRSAVSRAWNSNSRKVKPKVFIDFAKRTSSRDVLIEENNLDATLSEPEFEYVN